MIEPTPRYSHPSIREEIEALVADNTFLILTFDCVQYLIHEMNGDAMKAGVFLINLATGHQRPIGVHFQNPTRDDPEASRTIFLPPIGWSEERTAGWIATYHEELAEAFGPIAGGIRAVQPQCDDDVEDLIEAHLAGADCGCGHRCSCQ